MPRRAVPRRVRVSDRMQKGYVYWLTAPMGRGFDPDFKPELTPREMLALGVFGGKYMTDCRREFPRHWFTRAKLSPRRRDPSLNYFGVDASQSLAYWRERGWLHPDDPRGWFQWYCRYFSAGEAQTMRARSSAGAQCGAMSRNCKYAASALTLAVAGGSGRRYYIGRTTRAGFERD